MGRQSQLTEDYILTIVENIEQGAYMWVAAGAVGVSRQTIYNWLRLGERSREGDKYALHRRLFDEVSKARARARMSAESRVFGDNPFNWLRYGPGRERPGEPGWTESRELTGAEGGPIIVVNWDDTATPSEN